MYFYKRCIEYYQHLIINESLKRITKIEIMLKYQKCSTQTQVLITFTRIAQILYDLTRTRDATKQSAKCTIPVYQNVYN